jgi:hypothetical protein
MATTKVTLTMEEFDDDTGSREVTISRTLEEIDLQEFLYFLSDAARASGFSYVEAIGCKTINGDERWSEF